MTHGLPALDQVSSANLRSLASSLREGELSVDLSEHAVARIVGSQGHNVCECLRTLMADGMNARHLALLLIEIANARGYEATPGDLFDLVLSGPDAAGVPTRSTLAVLHELIEDAQQEVLIVGYAIYQGKSIFKRLAEKMDADNTLKVEFHLNIERKRNDTSLSSEIIKRFMRKFRHEQWPGARLPVIYYDPRALSDDWTQRAALHAKCVIIDRRRALITSANFTQAAQIRNIELGTVLTHRRTVGRITDYIGAMKEAGHLLPVHTP